MASGNLGDLFVSLGIKDEMSATLRKIVNGMKGVDQATQDAKKQGEDLIKALNGINGNNFSKVFRDATKYIEDNSKGIANIISLLKKVEDKADSNAISSKFFGAKDLPRIAEYLTAINSEFAKMAKDEARADSIKAWQSRISNSLEYIRVLQDIDLWQSKIEKTRYRNPNVSSKELDAAEKSLANIRSQIVGLLSSGGVDTSGVLGSLTKLLSIAKRDVNGIINKFKEDNPLSAFSGGAAKVEADISRVTEKWAKLKDLMSEGTSKGYSTSMLGGSITELSNLLSRLQSAQSNKSILTDEAQMKNLLSDVAVGMVRATSATQAYGREKGKVIAQERESNKAQDESKRKQKELADNTRNLKDLYSQLNHAMSMAEQHGMKGLQLGVSTSQLDKALADMRDFSNIVNGVSPGLMGKGGRPVFADYKQQAADLKRSLDEAVNSQKELNREQEKSNRKADAKAERDKAQAIREQNAAEKQRQNELENSLRRIQSMEKALANLQEKRFTSKMLGLDTSEAEAKISSLKSHIGDLYDIMGRLGRKDMTAVGLLGNLGNGREVQSANDLARSYDRANKEAQRGVDLEQKRQQEIAKSAAKVQADLVRGFEKANSSAGKLNSTIQDLKSLFLQGGLVFGAQQFAMSIITTGGEMEKQHIALQSILGDMQNANTLFGQIKELALNSPFTFSELNRDVKQLAAYGVEYDKLYDTTKRLADMSSGLGVSFDRIALAFGQVQARGWLDGKELRQIAYAGIPLLDKLSDFYSKQEGRKVSTSEIKTRISNREVSFDDVKNIFWQMTDAGGQFYNMQQTLSETLLGRYNKLKDAWEIMLAEFASGNSLVGSFFKTAIEGATTLVQALHSLALPAGTLFAGYALKKMLAGGTASNFLANKASMASNLQSRLLQGQQLSQIERNILATKGQITGYDLRQLASAKALTLTELNRLRIAGKITTEQYKTYRALVLQQVGAKSLGMEYKRMLVTLRNFSLSQMKTNFTSVWTGFASSGMAAIRLVGTGLKSLGATLWSAIGGLPGLIISGITFGITYAISEYQELSQKIKQTQDELADRNSQIQAFLKENNVSVAVAKGDDKEIDNMIDSYKEKLKQLAPYDYHNQVMTADEIKSHKERLLYLEEEIKLLKEANDVANNKMSNRSFYSDLEDDTEKTLQALERKQKLRATAMTPNATQDDKNAYEREKAFDNYIESYKKDIEKKFGDIAKDEKMRQAAMQSMSALFSSLGVPEDKADLIRASLLQAFGIGDKSNWLQNQVGDKMRSLIDATFPLIGDKIRSSIPLNDAEKAKVKELMGDAKNGLVQQYPELERTLQSMLAQSKFEAVIKLVVDGDSYNEMQSELVGRIPKGPLKPELLDKYRKRAKDYGKDNDWYGGRNASHSNIDKAFNNWQSAKKSDSKQAAKLEQEYKDEREISRTLLHDNYAGEGKKSNKPAKKTKGRQEDTLLKNLQERLSSLKSARQMYQKYKPYMSDDEAKKRTYASFPNVVGLDLDNYASAVDALIKSSKFKDTTSERKKFLTSVNREKAEWRWDEVEKPAIDVLASERNAYMDRLSNRWDLYKSLLEKTGNKRYAEAAWIDAFKMDDKSKSLMDLYYQNYGKQFNTQEALNMSDEEAKKTFKSADEYNEWKKIVDLLRSNYVQSLQDGADAMQQTMSVAQKLDSITEKYAKKRKDAGANQDLIDRYNFLEQNEKSGIIFDQLKSEVNWEGVFGNIDKYSKKELRKIRKDINSLISGGLLKDMSASDLKSFYDGMEKLNQAIDGQGFSGLKDLIAEMSDASQKYDEAVKEYNEAVAKFGKNSYQAEDARRRMQEAQNRKRNAGYSVDEKKRSRLNDILTITDMFRTLGSGDGSGSTLLRNAGGWTESLMKMFGSDNRNSSKVGGIVGMFAGLTEAISEKGFGKFMSDAFEDIGGAVNSIFKDMLGINLGIGGADYKDYNKAKEQYDNLISVWDSLISKKTEYMSIHWGTEATEASKEAQAMLQAEIEQTKIIAQKRLNSGASAGSHSIWYRMWKGSYDYNGQNWQDVAPEISKKYGVKFNGMEDLLNMNSETLSKIKQDNVGLWASMDSEYREYLEKLIEYGDKADDMIENLTEKLTGNKFSSLVESWGDAMASMANSSDSLVDNFEDNLKKTIVNSMIENLYKDKINAILAKAKKYGDPNGGTENITDGSGNVISAYTEGEYKEVMGDVEDVSKQIEATRDFLKKTYGWSDNSSSSSRNSVKGITEETADLLASYLNSIRLDVSVIRSEQAKYFPEMSEIAKSQLTQLNRISQNTLRNADAAERIETIVMSLNENFNRVLNGTKVLHVK